MKIRYVESCARALFHLISPSFCWACRVFLPNNTPLCDACLEKIQPVVSHELALTASKAMRVHAISEYREPLRSFILAKNYGNSGVTRQLGALMVRYLPLTTLTCDYIVPIPLHWTRYARRGFNQSQILAQCIGAFLHKPVVPLLKRVRRTSFQAELPASQRKVNLEHALVLNGTPEKNRSNKHIILVDDLMTTGATLTSAAHALSRLKPTSLVALVACRTLGR